MELRPRRGRSSQLPSTPTIPKPSPRPPPQSSARKKPARLPATPIHIPSDDEEADPKDAVAAAHQELVDDPALTHDNQDSNLPGDSEFETPLSSVAKARRLRNKVAASNAKRKNKVTSSVKKIAEEICSTPAAPQDVTYIADSSTAVLEKVGPDEATTRGEVSGPRNGDIALKETEAPKVLTESTPRDSIELAGEISVMAQEASVKKGEVLSPSSKGKTAQSIKKKSGKKRVEDTVRLLENVQNGGVPYRVANAETDQVNHQEHVIDADGPVVTEFQECHGTLSLILSDDETSQVSEAKRAVGREVKASASFEAGLVKAQVSDAKQAVGHEAKASASIEAALVKHGQAEISKASSKGKKSRFNKKDTIKEENFGRKLFEETNDATLAYMDKEPKDQVSGATTNLSKEGERKIDVVNSNKYGDTVISSSERHAFKSPSGSSKENDVADLESNGGKVGTSTAGVEGKDFGNECVHDVSEDSSHGAVSSSDESDEDTRNDCDDTFEVKHEEAKTSFEGTAVHDEECNNTDDDDDNASSGKDDDDEDEMASVFVNSMKAHLQKISEPSAISMPKQSQARQEVLERTESPFTKSAVKASCVNGSNGSSTGYGLSWSPDIVLSASKNHSVQAGKARNIAEARPNTVWGRDRCLQDGLCVPPVDPLKLNKLAKKQKDDTTGAKWFNLSAPTITPELKKELQLLKLRGALDPKRHYKAEDSKGLPKYFQVGTVVGGPADFYSGRLTKKEQKSSLADELLSDSSLTAYRKRKYTEIQEQKQAGGKGFWKQKKSKRTPAWAKI